MSITARRLSDIGVSPVITCIFTRLFYMIISGWNQCMHMFIDFFFTGLLIGAARTEQPVASKSFIISFAVLTA